MTPRLPGAGNALPRQFFVPACTLFLPRANGIIKLERRKITMKLIRTVDAAGQVLSDYACDPMGWRRKCLVNIAKAGMFSSDRTIAEYDRDIWHLGK